MGQEHDVEASTEGDSRRFPEECIRDINYDYSMLASRLKEEALPPRRFVLKFLSLLSLETLHALFLIYSYLLVIFSLTSYLQSRY